MSTQYKNKTIVFLTILYYFWNSDCQFFIISLNSWIFKLQHVTNLIIWSIMNKSSNKKVMTRESLQEILRLCQREIISLLSFKNTRICNDFSLRFLRPAVSIPHREKIRFTYACEAGADIRSRATGVRSGWTRLRWIQKLSAPLLGPPCILIYCQKVAKTDSVVNYYSVFTSIT